MDAKKVRKEGVSSPTEPGENEITTPTTVVAIAKISPNTSPNIADANAYDYDTSTSGTPNGTMNVDTPSGTPNAVDTVDVVTLSPDVRQMLEMIDGKTISKETESIEVK